MLPLPIPSNPVRPAADTAPRISRRELVGSAVALAIGTLGSPAQAGSSLKAAATWTARREAVAAIPLAHLDPARRNQVADVVQNPSVYRRLPVHMIRVAPPLHHFFVQRPEVMVNIWQVLKVSQVVLRPTGENVYFGTDQAGTKCRIEYLIRSQALTLVYAQGAYEGPLFANPVTGRCVLLLRCDEVREPGGDEFVIDQLDVFLAVDNAGLDLVAKTLGPLMGRYADYNFVETLNFVERLSHIAEHNPRGIARLADRLHDVAPPLRGQLAELAQGVAQRAAQRAQRPRVLDEPCLSEFANG